MKGRWSWRSKIAQSYPRVCVHVCVCVRTHTCADLWGSRVGEVEVTFRLTSRCFPSERESGGQHCHLSFLFLKGVVYSKIPKHSLMYWSFRILGSRSCRNYSICSPSSLVIREDFSPMQLTSFSGVKVLGPGRAGNNVCEALWGRWKEIQGISLITAGLPIPWTLRTHLSDHFMKRWVEKQD